MTFPKRDLSESTGGNAETIGSHDFQCGGFARNSRNVATIGARFETLRNRKIRYPLSVVEIRGHAVNFLGGMTALEENKGERGGWRTPYDVWDSKSNFRSFVNFVCPKSSRGLKGSSSAWDDIFSLFGKNLTAKLHFRSVLPHIAGKNG